MLPPSDAVDYLAALQITCQHGGILPGMKAKYLKDPVWELAQDLLHGGGVPTIIPSGLGAAQG